MNKPLCYGTKTEFTVFVNFSNGEFTTVSDYYLRHIDTAIDMFEPVVVKFIEYTFFGLEIIKPHRIILEKSAQKLINRKILRLQKKKKKKKKKKK